MRCPKLDVIIKNELPRDCLKADHKLSHSQNFVLDDTGPLATAYEEMVTQEEPKSGQNPTNHSGRSPHPGERIGPHLPGAKDKSIGAPQSGFGQGHGLFKRCSPPLRSRISKTS